MKRTMILIAAIAVVAAACGEGSNVDTGSTTSTTSSPSTTTSTTIASTTTQAPVTTPPSTTPPADPDQRILEVRIEGGLMPPEFILSQFPRFTLFADGRLVYLGATIAIFPGPLLPAVVQANIGDDGLSAVMQAIQEVGFPEIDELFNSDGINQVADGPNTEVRYFDENGEHFFSVYALAIADQTDPQVLRLRDLVALLDELTATSSDAGPFEIERLQVIARVQESRTDTPPEDVRPWPLSISSEQMPELVFALRCAVVSVEDDPSALAAFQEATQSTLFESEEATYRMTVRPLLTGEPGCETRA